MDYHKNGRRKISRQSAEDQLQRFVTSGRAADRNDVPSGRIYLRFLTILILLGLVRLGQKRLKTNKSDTDENTVGRLRTFWERFWLDEGGQDLVEYALLLTFIGLAAVGLLNGARASVRTLLTNINSTLTNVVAASS